MDVIHQENFASARWLTKDGEGFKAELPESPYWAVMELTAPAKEGDAVVVRLSLDDLRAIVDCALNPASVRPKGVSRLKAESIRNMFVAQMETHR